MRYFETDLNTYYNKNGVELLSENNNVYITLTSFLITLFFQPPLSRVILFTFDNFNGNAVVSFDDASGNYRKKIMKIIVLRVDISLIPVSVQGQRIVVT